MSMQYTEIFAPEKIENFDMFNILAQNIDRGYTLEPRRFYLTSTHNLCFGTKIRQVAQGQRSLT